MFKDIKLYIFCTLAAVLALIFAHLLWAGPMNVTRSEILTGETKARFGGLASSVPFEMDGKRATLNYGRDGESQLVIIGSNGSIEMVVVVSNFGKDFKYNETNSDMLYLDYYSDTLIWDMYRAQDVIIKILAPKYHKAFKQDFEALMNNGYAKMTGHVVQRLFGKHVVSFQFNCEQRRGVVSISLNRGNLLYHRDGGMKNSFLNWGTLKADSTKQQRRTLWLFGRSFELNLMEQWMIPVKGQGFERMADLIRKREARDAKFKKWGWIKKNVYRNR